MTHHFGLGSGHLPRRADTIARAHGAHLINYTEPHGERRHWFSAPNQGEPHNGRTASAVLAAIEAAGIRPRRAP